MNELCVSCHYARMRDDVCGIYCTGGFVENNGKCKHYKDCEEALQETSLTREEIVAALRCCAFNGEDSCEHCTECPAAGDDCESELQFAAADLIENQQREIEALRWANEGVSGDKICRAALEAFGERAQMTMAIEEMSELAKELCKRCRGRDNVEAIAEEVADVQIMLQQLVMLFDCAGQVETFRRYKLERLAERIEEVKG